MQINPYTHPLFALKTLSLTNWQETVWGGVGGWNAVQFYRGGSRKISLNNGKRHEWVGRQYAPSITKFRWQAKSCSLVI